MIIHVGLEVTFTELEMFKYHFIFFSKICLLIRISNLQEASKTVNVE